MPERTTPFSNGTEVDWFRAARCVHCALDPDGDGAGCDLFVLGVAVGGWPHILVELDRTEANPLGVDCTAFRRKGEEVHDA